jgi:hypothetical protein
VIGTADALSELKYSCVWYVNVQHAVHVCGGAQVCMCGVVQKRSTSHAAVLCLRPMQSATCCSVVLCPAR